MTTELNEDFDPNFSQPRAQERLTQDAVTRLQAQLNGARSRVGKLSDERDIFPMIVGCVTLVNSRLKN